MIVEFLRVDAAVKIHRNSPFAFDCGSSDETCATSASPLAEVCFKEL